METPYIQLSTGIPALDKVLQTIIPGDNVVWQVDSIDQYIPFVQAFAADALKNGRKLIYFRFAGHPELLPGMKEVETCHIDLSVGFETATAEIHRVIEKAGRGSYFIFDCLFDLSVQWYSDLMLGNFFMLTCPFIYYLDSVAYFAIIRHRHSLHIVASIRDTAQVILDVSRYKGKLYVHPMKVWQRYSPTMYLPHMWDNDEFIPVTDSATVSEVVSNVKSSGINSASRAIDIWYRTFIQAQETLEEIERGESPEEDAIPVFEKLLRMVISRDERIIRLVSKYLTLSDILEIKERLIGTGLIGGKSVGMLVARAILKNTDKRWDDLLEVHDSFYIGSDVFYTYIVMNGCWWLRKKQRDPDTFLDDIYTGRQNMLKGTFPEFILEQFVEMLDYFGQSPIIVRSSSLLEDNFGNAFSGKYESVFCANQGTRSERLEAFLSAVRRVYASTMSRDALMYRVDRDLLESDEQMALLVQRVSGSVYKNIFLPQIAGVGLSFNPYAWNEKIDPEAGVLRLVCGLGTRAVDRHDDDYTRITALNEPKLRPESNFDEMKQYAQKQVDVLDLNENKFVSRRFEELYKVATDFPFEIVASHEQIADYHHWVLTFEKLLSETTFIDNMRQILKTLQKAYEYPVDIEFTTNFKKDGTYQINLLQCRVLGMADIGRTVELPEHIEPEHIIMEAHGAIIGQSMATTIDRIIYVVPTIYGKMTEQNRYSVAKLIGRLVNLDKENNKITMLLGPGRWGTSMPFLGVPVKFREINTVSVMCEIVEMSENLVPDVSLGTHFFNDIVENNILYIAIFPHMNENLLNKNFLEKSPNKLGGMIPDEAQWSEAVRVIDTADLPDNQKLLLNVNSIGQKALCYLG